MTGRRDDHRLTIGFDGRALTSPAAGVRRYATNLLSALAGHGRDRFVAIGANPTAVPDGVDRVPATTSLPTNLGWAVSALPLAIRRAHLDVFHAPSYTAPLWGGTPVVLTIHDVSYARRPEWYPYRIDPARRWFYEQSARRARRVITDSAFSRDEIRAAYGLAGDLIDVVPLGVAAAFVPDPSARRELSVLHVGDIHRRRNLAIVLDAILDLRASEPAAKGLILRLIGADRGVLSELRAAAARAGQHDALEHVLCADDASLIAQYQKASLLAYPSRYEGFGLPVLEAMACGLPVVATTAGAVPEVTGSAALLADPDDARAWRAAIASVLTDPHRRHDLSIRGRRQAEGFTWTKTAELTASVYRIALAPQPPFVLRSTTVV